MYHRDSLSCFHRGQEFAALRQEGTECLDGLSYTLNTASSSASRHGVTVYSGVYPANSTIDFKALCETL